MSGVSSQNGITPGLTNPLMRMFKVPITSLVLVIVFICALSQKVSAAITIISLYGIPGNQSVTIQWETAAEFNLAGFNILRTTDSSSNFSRINPELIPSEGDAFIGDIYQYNDQSLTNGQVYFYRLQIVRTDNSVEEYGPLQVSPGATSTSVAPITPTVLAVTPTSQTPQATQLTPNSSSTVIVTSTQSGPTLAPTITPTQTITPSPTLSPTPTLGSIIIETITPVPIVDTSATETAVVIAVATNASLITPQATTVPVNQEPTSRDWIRIGILIVVGAIWVLLGIWMYYYLSRLTK
jgi:hypothetical protein